MAFYHKVLVDIICESILEQKIIDLAHHLGVHGYTILEARGGGSRGVRQGDFEYNKNIKIEIVCSENTAETLCDEIKEKYFEDYAVVIYVSHVDVMRSEKFK